MVDREQILWHIKIKEKIKNGHIKNLWYTQIILYIKKLSLNKN